MHRPGIEPGPPAWQASILPLNQRCSHDRTQRVIQKFTQEPKRLLLQHVQLGTEAFTFTTCATWHTYLTYSKLLLTINFFVGGSRGCERRAPPPAQNFFIFMQFKTTVGELQRRVTTGILLR